jgi:hypothetical protein
MEEIIIKELKATPKKTVLHFKISQHDPYDRVVTFDKPLPPSISSHLEAVATFVKKEADDLLEEDLRQEELDMDEDEVEVPEDGVATESDGMDEEESPEEEPEDYENIPLPTMEGTEIPAFDKMEKGHLIWYINNSGKDVLIMDVKFNFGKDLNPDATLDTTREQVLELIKKELKIQ